MALKAITVKIEPSELERVKQACEKSGENTQQLIRNAISRHLDRLILAQEKSSDAK
jgi:predicted DNA binding CopG/RHH family protein